MIPFFILDLSDPDDKEMMLELYEVYGQYMYLVAYGYVRNEKDAEDVVHNCWLSLCTKRSLQILHSFSDEKPLDKKNYLARCVRNRSIDLFRKRNASVPLEIGMLAHQNRPDDSPDAHLLIEAEVQDCIHAIQSLPSKQREYLSMRLVENLSYGEMAKILGMTKDSIRSQVSAALKRLRLKVKEMEE